MLNNKGVHIYSTSPDFKGLFDFEILLMEWSALKWKEQNGPIYLVCDNRFAEWMGERLSWYDKVILLEEYIEVDKKRFWAAGKIFAYKQLGIGHHFIDIDAVIHEPVGPFEEDMIAAHFDWSPLKRKAIGLESELNLSGINMAYSCFSNQQLLDSYIERAFAFMSNPTEPLIPMGGWEHMVYAEQTILGDLIREAGYSVKYLRDDSVPTMYHLWSGKDKIISGQIDKNTYISDLKIRIKQCQQHHLYQTSSV
jgi:hypothetical protein